MASNADSHTLVAEQSKDSNHKGSNDCDLTNLHDLPENNICDSTNEIQESGDSGIIFDNIACQSVDIDVIPSADQGNQASDDLNTIETTCQGKQVIGQHQREVKGQGDDNSIVGEISNVDQTHSGELGLDSCNVLYKTGGGDDEGVENRTVVLENGCHEAGDTTELKQVTWGGSKTQFPQSTDISSERESLPAHQEDTVVKQVDENTGVKQVAEDDEEDTSVKRFAGSTCGETIVKQVAEDTNGRGRVLCDNQTTVKQLSCGEGFERSTEETNVKHLTGQGSQGETIVKQMEETIVKITRGDECGGGTMVNIQAGATGLPVEPSAPVTSSEVMSDDEKEALLKIPMTDLHRRVLCRLSKDIENDLSSVYKIVNYLYQESILEDDQRENLELLLRQQERGKAVKQLLEILPCKSDYAFHAFRFAIANLSKQQQIIELLNSACIQVEQEPQTQDVFETFRVKKVPRYYVERQQDVDIVVQKLTQSEVVGIVGNRPAEKISVCESSDEESNSEDEDEEKRADIVGIRGWGGVGKTCLAQKVCEKMKRKLKVVWLSIGQNPNLQQLFNQIHKDLTGDIGNFADVDSGSDWLMKYSLSEQCDPFLLILDDVWDQNHAHPFTTVSQKCKILITTRDQSILKSLDATIHRLDPLDEQQSKRLLVKSAGLKVKSVANDLEKIITNILELLGGLPLAIVLIGSSLKRDRFELKDWQNTYQRQVNVKKTFWEGRKHIPDNVYKYRTIYQAFEVSFLALNPDQEASDDPKLFNWIQRRFLSFALFPDDIDVPSNVLYKLWEHQLSKLKTEEYLELEMHQNLLDLEDRSFLTFSKTNGDIKYYNIHDLLLDYTRYKLCKTDPMGLKKAHQEFLESYSKGLGDSLGVNLWWEVENDGYIYQFLAHHLFETESHVEFKALLWNIKWLEQKLFVTDIADVLSDFKYLKRIECKKKSSLCETEEDRLLQKSFILSSHILSSFKDQIYPQLVGRLSGHVSTDIQDFVRSITDHVKTQTRMLMPDAPCLSPPDGYRIQSLRHFSTVICAAFSRDKKHLYTGCADNQLRCFNLESGQVKIMGKEDQRHTGMVFTMAMEETSGYIVTGSFDNNIHLWPIDDNTPVQFRCFTGHTNAVFSVATVPDKDIIVSGSLDKSIRIWNIHNSQSIGVIENADQMGVREVAAIRNGTNTIVSVGEEPGIIKMWDFETKELKHSWIGHEGSVYAVRVTPDRTKIVTGGKKDFLLKVWDLKGQLLVECKGHNLDVFRCFITSDSQHILSGSLDKTARLWNINTGELERTFYGHGQAVWALYVSDDNKMVVTGGEDQLAILWNSDLSDDIHDPQLKRHNLEVTSLSSSPDGHLVVSTARDKTVKVWEWPTMKLLDTLYGHSDRVNCVIVSHCLTEIGKLLAISGSDDCSICVWNITPIQEKPIHVFAESHSFGVTALCTNDSGQYLFSGSHDNTIIIHDMSSFSLLKKLNCHQHSSLRHLEVTDSKLIAAFDGSVTCWDVPNLVQNLQKNAKEDVPFAFSQFAQEKFSHCCSPRHHMQGFIAGLSDVNKVRLLNIAQLIEFRLDTPHKAPGDLVSAVHSDKMDLFIWTGSILGNIGCIDRTTPPAKHHEIPCPLNKPCKVTSLKVSSSHSHCVAGYENGQVWAWSGKSDVFISKPTGVLLTVLPSSVETIDIYETGSKCLVAVSSAESTSIEALDVIANRKLFTLGEHTKKVTNVQFIANGTKLLTASLDCCIRLWDMSTGEILRADKSCLAYGVLTLAVDPKEEIYAVGGYENTIEIHSLSTGEVQSTLSTEEFYNIQNMYIRDANTIVCAFAREFYIDIDISTGKILYRAFGMQKENGPVSKVVNSRHIVSGSTHCKAKIWDVETGRTLCTLDAGSTRALLSACTMECGFVVTGSYDKVIKVWDVSNLNHPSMVASFAFEHAVMAVHEFAPNHLVVGLLNGQVCFLHVTS